MEQSIAELTEGPFSTDHVTNFLKAVFQKFHLVCYEYFASDFPWQFHRFSSSVPIIYPMKKPKWCFLVFSGGLTLSWRRSLPYRNQLIYLQNKSMDWFLYDRDLRHERVKSNYFMRLDDTLEHIINVSLRCPKKSFEALTTLKRL